MDISCSNGECTATGFTCECQDGYSGDGVATCSDIDECTDGTAECVANSSCANNDGGYDCNCNEGFKRPANGNDICKDINECNDGTHNCPDSNASCANNVGSFECTCDLGYEFNSDGTNSILMKNVLILTNVMLILLVVMRMLSVPIQKAVLNVLVKMDSEQELPVLIKMSVPQAFITVLKLPHALTLLGLSNVLVRRGILPKMAVQHAKMLMNVKPVPQNALKTRHVIILSVAMSAIVTTVGKSLPTETISAKMLTNVAEMIFLLIIAMPWLSAVILMAHLLVFVLLGWTMSTAMVHFASK